MPIASGAGLGLGILSAILGVAALSRTRSAGAPAGLATAGLLLAIVGIALGVRGLTAQHNVQRAVVHALNTPTVDASSSVGGVHISRCDEDAGHPVAEGTVANHAKRELTFWVTIAFKDRDGGTHIIGNTTAEYVPPGRTAHWSIRGYTDFQPVSCAVIPNPKSAG